jgi:hypothetical protein
MALAKVTVRYTVVSITVLLPAGSWGVTGGMRVA